MYENKVGPLSSLLLPITSVPLFAKVACVSVRLKPFWIVKLPAEDTVVKPATALVAPDVPA